VLYRAFFRYFYSRTTPRQYPDSTKTYYYEDSTAYNAHNPADTLFNPADSLPSAFGSKYYIYTIAYDTTGTKKFEHYYNPNTGDSARTTYASYDKSYNPGTVTDPNGGITYYSYQSYKNPGDTTTRYWPSPTKVKYPNGDSVLTYFSAKGDSNYRLPDSTVDEMGRRTHHYYDPSNNYVDTATVYKNRVLADGEGSSHDISQRYHYNAKGNLTETLDPLGHKTIMHYTDFDTGQYLIEQRIDMGTAGEGNEDIVTQYGYNLTQGTMDTMTFYKAWGGGSQTDYVYNYSSLLAKVTLNCSRTITNYYGGGGAIRVKKTDSQLGSRYYGPLSEHDSTGDTKKKYIYALGKCIAYVDSASNTHWMHQDAQGSTKLITGAYGAAENAYKYYPFGDSLSFTGTVKNDVKYTGQRYAEGIEAYDYNARYYDPEIGRFYSRDPLGSAASSPYAYCGNDPVNMVDPSRMVALPMDPDPGSRVGGGGDGEWITDKENGQVTWTGFGDPYYGLPAGVFG
jgi:RHS repeat-associated protein